MDAITGLMPLFQGIGTGTGLVGNVIGGIQRGQEMDALRKQQKILSNPAEVSKMVAGATQPLSQGLTQAVGNQVQGTEAERGLATSPGISAAILAQALAPYYQQNQSLALQQVLGELGQSTNIGQTMLGSGYGGGSSMSPALLAMMMRQQQQSTPGMSSYNIPGYSSGGTGDYGGGGADQTFTDLFGGGGVQF